MQGASISDEKFHISAHFQRSQYERASIRLNKEETINIMLYILIDLIRLLKEYIQKCISQNKIELENLSVKMSNT